MTINCKSAIVYDLQNGQHEVEITDPQTSDLLTAFELSDIIDHFGEEKILDQIGAHAAAKRFNLFTDSDVEDNMKPLREEIQSLREELKK